MKLILLLFLLFAFTLAEDVIICRTGCPCNLLNKICLHIQNEDGKTVRKVDVESQCHLDKYKCDNKILSKFI